MTKADVENVRPLFKKLLSDFEHDFYLDFIAAVDYVEERQFELSYNVWMYTYKTILTIKVQLPRENPVVDSISDLLPCATSHEQECYDLMGITFSGNSHLKRGFLVADEIADTFPLRKEEMKQS